ncbi:hypothetical protein ABZY44_01065 [Streptomyces sp. NPDC006544]|uniref:hypothetical protein n=1 Tax=Streptomyces sp. NPDC006544 TaxID=3154583 RepID=UPI0033ADC4B7
MTNRAGSGAKSGEPGGPPVCPWCGAEDTGAAVPEVPDGNGCLHFLEGTVMAAMAAAAGKHFADARGWPWLTPVGAVVALLVLAATIAVVRSDHRDRQRAQDAADRAAAVAAGAPRHCTECGDAFPAGG